MGKGVPVIPDDVARFGEGVAQVLRASLGDELVGAWFVGSLALGGFVPDESDVDVVAVCDGSLPDDTKAAIADDVIRAAARCPARGLELTVYRRAIAAATPIAADFEVNANGGPRMERTVHLDAHTEPWFWYVLDRAIAHRFGQVISGPPAAAVFVDVARARLLEAMVESMRWHREHEGATLYSVLNAARAWRYAAEDELGSKLEGATWARARWSQPEVLDAAVDLRHGRHAELDLQEVVALLDHVEEALTAAT